MEGSGGSRLVGGVIGVACIVGGAVMTLRPFEVVASLVVFVAVYLAVSGIGDIVEAGASERPRRGRLAGAALIGAAVAALAWPDATVGVVAFLAGIGMIIDGAVRLGGLDGTGDTTGARLRGIAGVVLGVLAMVWPTSTVLVVAALFGIRTVVIGVGFLAAAVTPAESEEAPAVPGRSRSRLAGAVGVGVALVGGLALAATSVAVHG